MRNDSKKKAQIEIFRKSEKPTKSEMKIQYKGWEDKIKKKGVEGRVRPTSGTALVAGAMGDVSW